MYSCTAVTHGSASEHATDAGHIAAKQSNTQPTSGQPANPTQYQEQQAQDNNPHGTEDSHGTWQARLSAAEHNLWQSRCSLSQAKDRVETALQYMKKQEHSLQMLKQQAEASAGTTPLVADILVFPVGLAAQQYSYPGC